MFAKWPDGQEGDLGQAFKVQVWSQVVFAATTGESYKSCTWGKRLLRVAEGEGRQDQRTAKQKLSVVLRVSPQGAVPVGTVRNRSRVFPALTSTSENGLPFPAMSEEDSPF